jgi:feruloyl-CoA synthase
LPALFAPPSVKSIRHSDGVIDLCSGVPLSPRPPSVLHWLSAWAAATPDAPFLTTVSADHDRDVWRYGSAWKDVATLAVGLASHSLAGGRVMVLASNSIEHMTVGFATMLAGGVYVPVAPQYAGPDADPAKLRGLIELLNPAFAYVEQPAHERAFRAAGGQYAVMLPQGAVLEQFGGGVAEATIGAKDLLYRLDPTAVTKILLTSGSTGRPKPVAYNQARMTANTQATLDLWPFIARHRLELVDWLPWNHAFGSNANINLVLSQGGTLHIDEAAGHPDRLALTIANLRRFRPTFHATVPAGFAALLPELEGDASFCETFFERMDALFSAGAAMHPEVHRRLIEASLTVRPTPVPILSGWGGTETGPGATMVHVPDAPPDCIGLPLPGVEVRLEPNGDKYQLLVRGHGVSDGYWSMPDATRPAFRDDGFFASGDAGELIDPTRPELGLRFTGRIADDFKLSNGTWVDANGVRARLLMLSGGRLHDLVVAGANQSALTVMAWGELSAGELDELIADYNRDCGGSSRRIAAGAMFDSEPEPQELSGKGQLIRAAVLSRRAAVIERLYEATAMLAARPR